MLRLIFVGCVSFFFVTHSYASGETVDVSSAAVRDSNTTKPDNKIPKSTRVAVEKMLKGIKKQKTESQGVLVSSSSITVVASTDAAKVGK